MSKDKEKKLTEKFNLRAKPGQVIPYAQADDGLRKRMKKTMQAIKDKPSDVKAVSEFGDRPQAKLGRATQRLSSLQSRFRDVEENFRQTLQAMDASLSGVDIDKMHQSTTDALNALTQGKPVPAPAQAVMDQMANMLPDLTAMAEKAVKVSEDTIGKMDALIDEARRIDRQRRDAARELGIHIGASDKLAQDFGRKFLDKAVSKYVKKKSDKNRQRLKDTAVNGERVNGQVAILKSARGFSFAHKAHMRGLRDAFKQKRAEVAETLAEYRTSIAISRAVTRPLPLDRIVEAAEELERRIAEENRKRQQGGPKAP